MQRLMQRTRYGLMARAALGLVAACLFMISAPAAASIEYPPLVKSYWGVKKLPVTGADGCPLCHSTDPGRLGTATQKFAMSLRSFGLQAKSDSLLKTALDKNKSKMTDSDGDGVADYQELAVDATNPNNASDHVTPMPMGTGGSGAILEDPEDAGVSPEGGAPSDPVNAGGADSGSEEIPDESLPECVPTTEEIYPTLGYGCAFGTGSAGSSISILAGVLAACLIRRGARASKGRRETLGQQT